MKIGRLLGFLFGCCLICCLFSTHALSETYTSRLHGFSIEVPDTWAQRAPRLEGTLMAYTLLGTGQGININVRDTPGIKTIKQVTLQELFSPAYHLVNFEHSEYIFIDGVCFVRCIFTMQDDSLKKATGGKYSARYLIFCGIRNEKLYTITFADLATEFYSHYPIFYQAINTLDFFD